MIELRTRLRVSLLVVLAAAAEASPQTASSGPPANQAFVHKTGKSGNSKSSPGGNSHAEASTGLCFQPGVGWQRIVTGQPNGSATRDAIGSLGAANPQSAYPRLSSAKQARSVECGGILTDKNELGAGVGTFAIPNPNRATRSTGSKKPGAVTSFDVNPPFHPNSRASLNSIGITPSAMPSAPLLFNSEAGSDEHSDQVGERAFHAYISSIKLRKLIRNAPDFRTRMKLEQLQKNPAPQLHHARVDTKTGQGSRKPLRGERVGTTSLRRSDANGRPRGNPRD
jgi:hypothetical protein